MEIEPKKSLEKKGDNVDNNRANPIDRKEGNGN